MDSTWQPLSPTELNTDLTIKDPVQQLILATAKKMFLEQGYLRTSLRKIANDSGIQFQTVTSLYKTKDEVFEALVSRAMLLAQQLIRQEVAATETMNAHSREIQDVYQYLFLLALELEGIDNDALVCSLYQVSYTTPSLFEKMVDRQSTFAYSMFARKFTSRQCYERVLLVRSAVGGYIMIHRFKRLMPKAELKKMLLQKALEAFEVPERIAARLISEMMLQEPYMLDLGRKLVAMV